MPRADFLSCRRPWCCSAPWRVSVRTPRSKSLVTLLLIHRPYRRSRCFMSVCLPLQAVRGAAAGFHLHICPDACRAEGQAAGQSLQTPAEAAEGPAQGESGTHLTHIRSVFTSASVKYIIKDSNCCVLADVHVQLCERGDFNKFHRFTFGHAALLQVSTWQIKVTSHYPRQKTKLLSRVSLTAVSLFHHTPIIQIR